MRPFLNGAIMMASFVAGLFFLRFWRRAGDRFFAIFALAFWMMAAERFMLGFLEPIEETRTFVHLLRLVAFALIALAVLDKNRAPDPAPQSP